MSLTDTIGIITGIATLIAFVVATTRYVVQVQYQYKLDKVNTQKEQVEKANLKLDTHNQILLHELLVVRKSGAVASAKKDTIIQELKSLINLFSAEAGSIYLPLHDELQNEILGLVFLAIEPVTAHTIKLRNKIIPMHSLAGKCFKDANSILITNTKNSDDHYKLADKLSGYKTQNAMNVPLQALGRTVGVLQLLNKKEDQKFSEDDLEKIQPIANKLSIMVMEYSSLPSAYELLGISPDTRTKDATILFCDMTASSILFQELNMSSAIQHINEYFEVVCNIAFKYGATVDKYMGDGILFRFNVPHPIDNHPVIAIKAAIEMNKAFEKIKQDWLTLGEIVEKIYTRCGLAYGPVQQATVGHPQYQYLTIFGRAVNASVNLCENAPRSHSSIIIDQNLYDKILKKVENIEIKKLPEINLGKAQIYTKAAYEVSY